MKIGYFFIVCFFVIVLAIKSNIFDEITSGNRSIFEDIVEGGKKWWASKAEENKESIYKVARENINNTLPFEYLKTTYIEPNVNYSYDLIMERLSADLKKGARVAATGAAVGAATYGLYRWLTRRGLGGITNDSRAINKITTKLLQEIDKKILNLRVKKSLSTDDEETVNALLRLIDNQVTIDQQTVKKLNTKKDELQKLLKTTIDAGHLGK